MFKVVALPRWSWCHVKLTFPMWILLIYINTSKVNVMNYTRLHLFRKCTALTTILYHSVNCYLYWGANFIQQSMFYFTFFTQTPVLRRNIFSSQLVAVLEGLTVYVYNKCFMFAWFITCMYTNTVKSRQSRHLCDWCRLASFFLRRSFFWGWLYM